MMIQKRVFWNGYLINGPQLITTSIWHRNLNGHLNAVSARTFFYASARGCRNAGFTPRAKLGKQTENCTISFDFYVTVECLMSHIRL
jgi:hypothetical protein